MCKNFPTCVKIHILNCNRNNLIFQKREAVRTKHIVTTKANVTTPMFEYKTIPAIEVYINTIN